MKSISIFMCLQFVKLYIRLQEYFYLQEIRRRRQETTVELRKNKRDDVLSKKRQTEGLTADSTDDEDLRENLSSARYYLLVWNTK